MRTRTSGSTTISVSMTLLPISPGRLDMPYQRLADASVPGVGAGGNARTDRREAHAESLRTHGRAERSIQDAALGRALAALARLAAGGRASLLRAAGAVGVGGIAGSTQARFQRLGDVDHVAVALGLLGEDDLLALLLGGHQLVQRLLVAVLEQVAVELAADPLDQGFRHMEIVLVDLHVADVIERVLRLADLVGVAQRDQHHALAARLDHDGPLAPSDHGVAESSHPLRLQRLTDSGENVHCAPGALAAGVGLEQ